MDTGSFLSCRKRRILSGLKVDLEGITRSLPGSEGAAKLILVIFLKIAVTFFGFQGFHR